MSFINDPAFVNAFRVLGEAFLVRSGHFDTAESASAEINMILERVGLEALVESSKKPSKFENEAYVFMDRKGAKVAMSRRDRIGVALTLSNIINHASVEAGYY